MFAEEEEARHFHSIVHAFKEYKKHTLQWIQLCENNWANIPAHQRALLDDDMKAKFVSMRTAAKHNGHFIDFLLVDNVHLFANEDPPSSSSSSSLSEMCSHHHYGDGSDHGPKLSDIEKVKSTLRQFVRDWSVVGQEERHQCYGPILRELAQRFPVTPEGPDTRPRNEMRVLCPGAGLGRLAMDITAMGFNCEGNEFSYFMLIASNFILNKSSRVNEFTLFPFLHQNVNVLRTEDQLAPVRVPDVLPSQMITPGVEFAMSAGEFVETYRYVPPASLRQF
eukprot:TRINITY_DN3021_c0_g1_i6.p1 TRINITY_DN3021_c0_g1~~TRINITY_DN3021_c0_g1_i6.p1  ORF type:complete len:279 (+),score=57.86 TRINITY_DN3021_c0_g1_i6:606-1442(+)